MRLFILLAITLTGSLEAQLQGGEARNLRHILVKNEAIADAILERLADGGDFKTFARKYSLDVGTKPLGGALDWTVPQSLEPEFARAAWGIAKKGGYAKCKTRHGWHVIQFVDSRPQPGAQPVGEACLPLLADVFRWARDEAPCQPLTSGLWWVPNLELPAEVQREFSLIGQLLYAVLGLALVEQVFRNTPPEQRWGIKYLCFGLGASFVFDFYLYTDALLFHRLDGAIWSARGFVSLMIVPMIGISAARNPDWNLPVLLSRRMVLHSTTLFSAGLYMLLMALAVYYLWLKFLN